MIKQRRVIALDIETFPLEVYVWGIRDQHIAVNQIKEDWSVASWAAKWFGDDPAKIVYKDTSQQKDVRDDRRILKPLWNLLNEAEIVISQNGKKFDSRRLNARLIMHGMKPPAPYKHLDTYEILSRVADLTSNKLEYYTAKLCPHFKKLQHKNFPGMTLWTECLKKNPKAWAEMREYNIHDVLSTEDLLDTVKAWVPEYMPKIFAVTDTARECGTCGHVGQMIEGPERLAASYRYKQHRCPKCGSWQKGERIKAQKAA